MSKHEHILGEPRWIWDADYQTWVAVDIIETATCRICGQVVVA